MLKPQRGKKLPAETQREKQKKYQIFSALSAVSKKIRPKGAKFIGEPLYTTIFIVVLV
jgi:hypothetical protein